jgi:hypothetical protein
MPTVNVVKSHFCEGVHDTLWGMPLPTQTWHLKAWNSSGGLILEITNSYGSDGQANVSKINDFVTRLAQHGYILTLDQANDIIYKMSHGHAPRASSQELSDATGGCENSVRPGASFNCQYDASTIVNRAKNNLRPKLASKGFSI